MKNAIPKSVKICAHWHTVRMCEVLKDDGDDLNGEIYHAKAKINLSQSPAASVRVETLWHEILHSIEAQGGLHLKEDAIRILAVGVFQVLCDNPEMRRAALYTHAAPDC